MAKKTLAKPTRAENYKHHHAESPMRPEIGTQAQFKKAKPPRTYRYDSSLSPAMEWDGQNAAREQGEQLLKQILDAKDLSEAKAAADKLKALGKPFLNWAGKAERLSFDVPSLPLFVHERLSTKAIIETLKGHRKEETLDMFDLFGDPHHSVTDQILRAYEHRDKWVNRMILGDSLVVMNSLLEYEGLGGQVQMIFMDPPYGVKFGSNFQPFVRKREVAHNDDEDMTREPEMVQAYRDTWELGLHSYLTYMRDRLLLARGLLAPSGSIFVQIGDENVGLIRTLLDEVFGSENCCAQICFQKTGGQRTNLLSRVGDYLLWYAKDITQVKYRQLYWNKADSETADAYRMVQLPDGTRRSMTPEESNGDVLLPEKARRFQSTSLTSQNPGSRFEVQFEGRSFYPPGNQWWKTNPEGMQRLIDARRVVIVGNTLRFVRFLDDFPVSPLNSNWPDTGIAGYASQKAYVVETSVKVLQRCILMVTDPGDLVFDPTCGSGTTAYTSELWGRRWITVDVSRVPLALARQRLLTATFPYFQLKGEAQGPAGGFAYLRKRNAKGEEVGGIVPHVTLKSIASAGTAQEEVLVDRPEVVSGVTRVSGPFVLEGTIPTPLDWEDEASVSEAAEAELNFNDRMLEILRRSPILHVGGGRTVTLTNIRPPAKTLSISAEAMVSTNGKGSELPVALVFGPENGAASEKLVYEAAKEAGMKNYSHLYVIGFAIQPNARALVENSAQVMSVPATYVQATPDLLMGDLLKNMRSSQIFSVCGLPEVEIKKLKDGTYQVELLGLDVFDPITMEARHPKGMDVPAWFLDTDYN